MVEILFGLVGGLGLFLFGMHNMADGLQKTAGHRLKRLLEVLTTNRVTGVLVGAAVTALLQSSSTVTVMTVGFVNARLMTLQQAVGVIMGANIGTTVTAQLIAFRLDDYALPAIGVGVALLMFAKRERVKFVGQVLMGFGMLFLGLEVMTSRLRPLRESAAIREILLSLGDNPLLGVVFGAGITAVLQSSSASIGLLQSMAAEGLIPLRSALPILFGDNIGTTITAVLSAIGASVTAKRAAAVHVVFNVIGTVLFLLAMPLMTPVIAATSSDIVRQIANAHAIFNIANTIIQLPFAGAIVWLVVRLVPDRTRLELLEAPRHLDVRLLETPSVAINVSRDEIFEMAALARETVSLPLSALLENGGPEDVERALAVEQKVNQLNLSITEYLSKLAAERLSNEQSEMVAVLISNAANIERVGDHGENIAELVQVSQEEQLPFSDTAKQELRQLAETTLRAYDLALEAWREADPAKAKEVFELEKQVDAMERSMRASHIERLNRGECHPTSGVVFLDLASNLERIADHAANIADQVVEGRAR